MRAWPASLLRSCLPGRRGGEPNGTAKRVGLFELRDADDAPVKLERVVGRGGSLHVLSDAVLYEISLHEVLDRRAR